MKLQRRWGFTCVYIKGNCVKWHFVLNHSAIFCWKLESFFLHKLYQNCSKSMFSCRNLVALATFKQKSNLISLLPIWYLAVKESVNIKLLCWIANSILNCLCHWLRIKIATCLCVKWLTVKTFKETPSEMIITRNKMFGK